MVKKIIVSLMLLVSPSLCMALDQGHFKELDGKDLDYVLTAFQNVNLYYLVLEKGGSIMFGPVSDDPKISVPIQHGLMLYFNPLVSEQARTHLNLKNYGRLVTRSTQANKIIQALFSKRHAQPSEDNNDPDYVILHSYEPIIDTIEFLVTSDKKPFIIKSKDGSNVIRAFLDRNKAINFQSALSKKGIKVDRIGIDESAFIQFIVSEGKRGNFILVEEF